MSGSITGVEASAITAPSNAVHVDGNTFWAQLSGNLTTPDSSYYSFSGWVKFYSLPSSGNFMMLYDIQPPGAESGPYVWDAGQFGFEVFDPGSGDGFAVESAIGTITLDGQWHHLFGWIDGTVLDGRVYLDGVDVTLNKFPTGAAPQVFPFNGLTFDFPDDLSTSGASPIVADYFDWWIGIGVLETDVTIFRDPVSGQPNDPSTFPSAAFLLTGDSSTFLLNAAGSQGPLTVQTGALLDAPGPNNLPAGVDLAIPDVSISGAATLSSGEVDVTLPDLGATGSSSDLVGTFITPDVSATGTANSPIIEVDEAVSSVSTTGFAGIVSNMPRTLTGLALTTATGSVTVSTRAATFGVLGIRGAGTIAVAEQTSALAASASGQASVLVTFAPRLLSGASATASIGTAGGGVSVPIGAIHAVLQIGTLSGHTIAVTLSGVQASSALGLLQLQVQRPITGVRGISGAGNLARSITVALPDISASSGASDLITVPPLPAVAAAGFAGAVTTVYGPLLIGVEGDTAASQLGRLLEAPGAAGQASVGNVTIQLLKAVLGLSGATGVGVTSDIVVAPILGASATTSVTAVATGNRLGAVSGHGFAGTLIFQVFKFLFADSFDYYTSTSDFSSNYLSVLGQTLVASSNTAYRLGQAASGVLTLNGVWTTGSNEPVINCSVLLKYASTAANANNTMALTLQDGSNNQVSVVWAGNGSITVRTGGTTGTIIQTISNAFRLNVWDSWQVIFTIGSSGSVEIRKNGVTTDLALASGNTQGGSGNSYANRFLVSSSSAFWQIDDLMFNVGWPGEARGVQQVPNSDASVAFTATGPNHYLTVQTEDGDTSYVQATMSGQEDLYGLTSVPITASQILGVQFYMSQRNTTSGAGSGTLQVRSSGTDVSATSFLPQLVYRYVTTFQRGDPHTGSTWTVAAVNAMQMGPKRS